MTMMMINLSLYSYLNRIKLLVIVKLNYFYFYIIDIYNVNNILNRISLIYRIVICLLFINTIILNNWTIVQGYLDILLIYFNHELFIDSGFVKIEYGFPTNQPGSYGSGGFGNGNPNPSPGSFNEYLAIHSDDNSPYEGYTLENIYSKKKYFARYDGEKYYTEYGIKYWINFTCPWIFESGKAEFLDKTTIQFTDEKHFCKYILAHRHVVKCHPNINHIKLFRKNFKSYELEKNECEFISITTRDISISNLLNPE